MDTAQTNIHALNELLDVQKEIVTSVRFAMADKHRQQTEIEKKKAANRPIAEVRPIVRAKFDDPEMQALWEFYSES